MIWRSQFLPKKGSNMIQFLSENCKLVGMTFEELVEIDEGVEDYLEKTGEDGSVSFFDVPNGCGLSTIEDLISVSNGNIEMEVVFFDPQGGKGEECIMKVVYKNSKLNKFKAVDFVWGEV